MWGGPHENPTHYGSPSRKAACKTSVKKSEMWDKIGGRDINVKYRRRKENRNETRQSLQFPPARIFRDLVSDKFSSAQCQKSLPLIYTHFLITATLLSTYLITTTILYYTSITINLSLFLSFSLSDFFEKFIHSLSQVLSLSFLSGFTPVGSRNRSSFPFINLHLLFILTHSFSKHQIVPTFTLTVLFSLPRFSLSLSLSKVKVSFFWRFFESLKMGLHALCC